MSHFKKIHTHHRSWVHSRLGKIDLDELTDHQGLILMRQKNFPYVGITEEGAQVLLSDMNANEVAELIRTRTHEDCVIALSKLKPESTRVAEAAREKLIELGVIDD